MTVKLNIAVLGAGFAGCASAIVLSELGHQITLLERVPVPKPVGAGIMIQPTGMMALAKMGALGPVLSMGAPVEALWCQTPSGRRIIDLRYAQLHPRLFGLGLHRGALFTTLFEGARARGVEVHCGVEGHRLVPADIGGAPRWHVEDEAGRRLPDPDAPAFDLVVVATGAGCTLEGGPRLKRTVREYPWGALWAVLPDRPGPHAGRLFQVTRGTRTLFGLLPTGRLPGDPERTVSVFWSLALSSDPRWREAGLPAWKARALEICPEASPVLDQIVDADQLLVARYRDVRMPRWGRDGVLYIGDAAHATSPQLGQGTNLALLDAVALGEAFEGLERAEDVGRALARYHALRRVHLRWYQWATRWLTPLFQSDLTFLGPARDLALSVGNQIPAFRGQMIRTMAGIKRGTLRRSMAIPPLVEHITELGP